MSDPFIGQIVMFAGNFAPRDWAQCDGQILLISQNTAMFSILGTTYGGDGRTTFQLPDLRGRVAMHYGNGPGLTNRPLGQKSGTENTTLITQNIPPHTHLMRGNSGQPDESNPEDGYPANSSATGEDLYASSTNVSMGATGSTGSGTPFSNIQPFQCVNFIIAVTGVFPSQN
ncbi:MAG: phage tail protein [Akkermansiaceae bacterium]|nr:phage tail protein [Akkermansiaceae bacterium]NNM28154.1 phage tail protein [Akkermansiaceae bacterium]